MFSSIWGSNYLSVIHFCIEICYCSSTGCPMILHENSKKIAQWWFYARIILHRCEIITWWPKNSHWKCLHCHQSHLHRSLHIFSLIHCFTQSEKHQIAEEAFLRSTHTSWKKKKKKETKHSEEKKHQISKLVCSIRRGSKYTK